MSKKDLSHSQPYRSEQKDKSSVVPFWSATLGLALILYAPIPVFLKHQRLSPLSPEGASVALVALLISATLLISKASRGRVGLSLLYGLSTLFFIDFQFAPTRNELVYALLLGGLVLTCWVLFERLPRIATVLFGLMVVTSFLPRPTLGKIQNRGQEEPPIIHLVLDEHVGIEGLGSDPRSIEIKHLLRTAYVRRGFRLFEGAFSQYDNTKQSLDFILNGSIDVDRQLRAAPGNFALKRTQLFDAHAKNGYQLNVYQTDFMDFCKASANSINKCSTYSMSGLKQVLSSHPWYSIARVQATFSAITRRSRLLTSIRWRYRKARSRLDLPIPPWAHKTSYSGALIAPSIFDELANDAENGSTGRVFFAHVIAPHWPYSFDRSCSVRPLDSWKIEPGEADRRPLLTRKNEYLDQVECVTHLVGQLLDRLLQIEALQDATIVIHSDHGPRLIEHSEGEEDASDRSRFLDRHSTLLAIRSPKLEPGSEGVPISIRDVLSTVWSF